MVKCLSAGLLQQSPGSQKQCKGIGVELLQLNKTQAAKFWQKAFEATGELLVRMLAGSDRK